MLLLSLLLVPMVLAAEGDRTINNYVVTINDHTLKSVQPTEKSSIALDLSGLGLRDLDKDAFAGLATLRNLSLANNSLSSIPNGLFSRLTSLEHLQLADNNISRFSDAFDNLSNLKTLDISNNRLERLREGELYGLPRSSVVLTKGLDLQNISTCVFEKSTNQQVDPDLVFRQDEETEKDNDFTLSQLGLNDINAPEEELEGTPEFVLKVKVCIRGDVLTLVEPLRDNETLPAGCRSVDTDHGVALDLEKMGISKFASGWCRLRSTSLVQLSFNENKIVRLTREALNDLPSQIHFITFTKNKIERLEKGIIENRHVKVLSLDSNSMKSIDEDALAKTAIRVLYLYDNSLRDTKFIETLPSTLDELRLDRNQIADVPPGTFANLPLLSNLDLAYNKIEELTPDFLSGPTRLKKLSLSANRMSIVPSGLFQQLRHLESIDLSWNGIARFENGTFDGLKLRELDVSVNTLKSIKEAFPEGLPPTLETLHAYSNEIERLDRGDFVGVPTKTLGLEDNKISMIERGAFDLPSLTHLRLDFNKLSELDADSFQGLDGLQSLSLSDNGFVKIPKAFTRHMRNLTRLAIAMNPIERLENGALYGFKKAPNNILWLYHNKIEAIEGGLFDNM